MPNRYDVVQASLGAHPLPEGTVTVHFVDTWNGHSVTGDTSWDGVTLPVTCDLLWDTVFIANSYTGSPVGPHQVVASCLDASNTLLGSYTADLTVPGTGLPILVTSPGADGRTHDQIYGLDLSGTSYAGQRYPSLIQQPGGTYLHLPTAGGVTTSYQGETGWLLNCLLSVGPDAVFVCHFYQTGTIYGSIAVYGLEVLSRPLGDTSSAWTQVVTLAELLALSGLAGSGANEENPIGFLADADGGLWLSLQLVNTNTTGGDTTQGNPNHVYHLAPGASTWVDVQNGAPEFYGLSCSGPRKTLPTLFYAGRAADPGNGDTIPPSPALPAYLAIWDGSAFQTLTVPDALGATWSQNTVCPVFALSPTEAWGYVTNRSNGTLDFYHMVSGSSDGPHPLTCAVPGGGTLIFGDSNLWPTSLGQALIWDIGIAQTGWYSPYYMGALFDPVARTVTAAVLTPPSGDQFGAFPVSYLTPDATLPPSAQFSHVTETQDGYLLVCLK